MTPKYRLFCEYCNYSRYSDGTDVGDLIAHKRAQIQTAIPKLDPKTNKTVIKKFLNLPKQFKCPKCGNLITPKKIKEKKNEQDFPGRDKDSPAGF